MIKMKIVHPGMNANVTHIDPDLLRRFKPLDQLPLRTLKYIAGESSIESLKADSTIHARGASDHQVSYLLSGDVELIKESGKTDRVSAGSERGRNPLSILQPFDDSAKTRGPVTLLKLSRELYESICRLPSTQNQAEDRTQPAGLDARERTLYENFCAAVLEGKLDVPSMPDIAMRIAKTVNNPETDSEDIARVIQADPTVAARLISVVNSAAYRGASTINSLPGAVSRLGRNVIHNLVISFALGSLFRSRSQVLQEKMQDLWKHSCYVAAICHVLGKVTPGKSADHALLCGLVHDIGALPIIGAARSHPEITDNPKILDRAIQQLAPEVGAMVLKRWAFGDDFIQTALRSEDWMQDSGDKPSYLDLVIVAQLHAYIGTERMRQLPRIDLVPAFHKLALGRLTPRHSIGVLEDANEQIRELQSLLSGN